MFLFLLSETKRGSAVLIFIRRFDPKLIKKRTVTNCAAINFEHCLDSKNLQQCMNLQSGRILDQEKMSENCKVLVSV